MNLVCVAAFGSGATSSGGYPSFFLRRRAKLFCFVRIYYTWLFAPPHTVFFKKKSRPGVASWLYLGSGDSIRTYLRGIVSCGVGASSVI